MNKSLDLSRAGLSVLNGDKFVLRAQPSERSFGSPTKLNHVTPSRNDRYSGMGGSPLNSGGDSGSKPGGGMFPHISSSPQMRNYPSQGGRNLQPRSYVSQSVQMSPTEMVHITSG